MTSLLDKLLALVFPDRCAGCKRIGTLFCATCRAALTRYPDMSHERFEGMQAVRVGYVFEGPLRAAIHQFKYQRQRRLAQPLSELLVSTLGAHSAVVMAVPLHKARLHERGFNQADDLARAFAQAARLPHVVGKLVRTRATEQQAQLDARARQANMHGAFAWQSNDVPTRVLLVDDVLTTGATMSACAFALRTAGCNEVTGLALARSRAK